MGRIGLPELMIILFIVIIIFGANRLPQLGRGIGSAIKNFKDGIKDETRRPQVIGSPAHLRPASSPAPGPGTPGEGWQISA